MKNILMAILFGVAMGTLCFLVSTPAHAQQVPFYNQGSTAAEGGHVFAGTMLSTVSVTWNAATTARYLMVFDGTAIPSNGSTTLCGSGGASGCLAYCAFMPNSTSAPSVQTFDWGIHPLALRNGIAVAISTGAGCGTLTKDGNNDFIYGMAR